ncbi:MAG: aminopeptidase [Desulfuromonas sp.]|nr:MAG: aminopeptidase [Desulfuromonas sp.]
MTAWIRGLALLALLPALTACGDLGYYLQCARGHLGIMAATRPIERVIADPATTETTRERLETVVAMRNFAVSELALPDNDSYRRYADIGSPYVIWNLVAAEEFSLQPYQWCFPIAGCVPYKGFFSENGAQRLANKLRGQSYEVDVYGVEAYSTLNWFADPVLNTFIATPDSRLAGLLFHELAHQLIYIADDTPLNEAFAMTVQNEGVRRWFERQEDADQWQLYVEQQRQGENFRAFLRSIRNELEQLYIRELSAAQMRREKLQIFSHAKETYVALKKAGQFDSRYDAWMSKGLNNARLAGIATYDELRPEFQALLISYDNELPRFYVKVRELTQLPPEQRQAFLRALTAEP